MPKLGWTIAIVNFNTSVYIKWVLKTLYEFNNPNSFKIVLIDNTIPTEKNILEEIIASYNKKYNNIELIVNKPNTDKYKKLYGRRYPSGEHGEALSIAFERCDTPYFLAVDPDFFWTKRNILKFFEKLIQKGYIAIGAPYFSPIGFGDPNFPGAFGCAYVSKYLQSNDFMPGEYTEEEYIEFEDKYNNEKFVWPFDVGWKIRKRLSDLKQHISFEQVNDTSLLRKLGNYGVTAPRQYSLNNEVIGYHLIGGARKPSQVFGFMDKPEAEQDIIYENWKKIRNIYGEYFYNILYTNKNLTVHEEKYLEYTKNLLLNFIRHPRKNIKKIVNSIFNFTT